MQESRHSKSQDAGFLGGEREVRLVLDNLGLVKWLDSNFS
jgi:hypothetical protein